MKVLFYVEIKSLVAFPIDCTNGFQVQSSQYGATRYIKFLTDFTRITIYTHTYTVHSVSLRTIFCNFLLQICNNDRVDNSRNDNNNNKFI